MPKEGFNMVILHRAVGQGLHEFTSLPCGIQPIARKRDDQELRLNVPQRRLNRLITTAHIKIIKRFGNVQITVGIKALNELLALVFQVTFDSKLGVEGIADVLPRLQATTELQ